MLDEDAPLVFDPGVFVVVFVIMCIIPRRGRSGLGPEVYVAAALIIACSGVHGVDVADLDLEYDEQEQHGHAGVMRAGALHDLADPVSHLSDTVADELEACWVRNRGRRLVVRGNVPRRLRVHGQLSHELKHPHEALASAGWSAGGGARAARAAVLCAEVICQRV